MRKAKLPLTIDPLYAAQKRLDYQGVYTAQQVERLALAVASVDSDVACDMSFAVDEQHVVVIHGEAQVSVTQVCQRCNQPFSDQLVAQFCCSPVRTRQQAELLPQAYDPIDVDPFGEIDLLALVEDELIVSLPVSPRHDPEQCEVSADQKVFGVLPAQPVSPFAVLANVALPGTKKH